jgi:hypothetical protein
VTAVTRFLMGLALTIAACLMVAVLTSYLMGGFHA